MLLVVFLLAFIALKTCAAHDEEVSFEEAEAIAREAGRLRAGQGLVRGVQRGLDAHLFWAVSLSTQNAAGVREECATVMVDAETGETETRTVLAPGCVAFAHSRGEKVGFGHLGHIRRVSYARLARCLAVH